jgi:membrane fusion protein (multidrug efflux system)
MSLQRIASTLLVGIVVVIAGSLATWKTVSIRRAEAAAQSQPEPMESVQVAEVKQQPYHPSTTAIGTVVALRSITLRNELPGTVHEVHLTPGRIVEAGAVLVALDVSVEEADLRAQEAQAKLAQLVFERMQRMNQSRAVSDMDVDNALAARDVAMAQIARTKAVIARKIIRAPFRVRVGISDLHPGQYLNEGTQITTLQGVDAAVYVDFTVAQHVAIVLRKSASVEVTLGEGSAPVRATVLATDARVDPTTRNAIVRARIDGATDDFSPGASVRVAVPVGPTALAATVPVSALRKGPDGDHLFVVETDEQGKSRVRLRRVIAGEVLGDDVVIEKGISTGERVAASGSFKLHDSGLVAVLPVTTSTAGG